jgi:hypothetical protein
MRNATNVRVGGVLILAALVLMTGWLAFHVALSFYVDGIWFGAVGYGGVFWTMFWARAVLAAVSGGLTFAALYLNIRIARRACPAPSAEALTALELDGPFVETAGRIVVGVAVLFVAVLVALSVAQNWTEFLNYRYAGSFGASDPVFGHDIGFYVFRMPAIAYTCQIALIVTFLCMAAVVAVYFMRGAIQLSGEGRLLSSAAFSQISALGGVAAVLLAGRLWLARYQVLFAKRGAVSGAGYADIHAQIGANTVLAVLALVLAAWLFFNARQRRRPGNLYALVAFGVAWLAIGSAYPALVQMVAVNPNEFERERPYIERNIASTRQAYGLDQVEERAWPGDGALDAGALARHPGTTENLLLWDPAPLLDIFKQKQRIRLYYTFSNVDLDRYRMDGKLRPMMVGTRELDLRQLPEKSLVWTNLHLQYTHGYGLCMSLGNEAEEGGIPEFMVRDIPPVTSPGLDVVQPRIYYGEQTFLYALAHTKLDEFDYPGDPDNYFNRYDGKGGVPIGGFFRRLLLTLYTGDKEILFTDQFTDQSSILLFRQVRQRVQKIAPFLNFDEDPYPVLLDGRVVWVLDAYTLTRRYPYSESVGIANYWRNSVKATVDAYDGTVTFYRFDAEDPILRVFERIFPDLFKPIEDMPEGLRAHLRYPQDLFRVQTALYRRYHMEDAQMFFNGEDMWTFPKGGTVAAPPPRDAAAAQREEGPFVQRAPVETETFEPPRYLVLELPESGADEQFVLSRTFTVEGKDNMIAWMAAGCDPEHYGKLTVYRLPKQRNIYGPNQAKGRFNQDPDVSQFMTLMGQMGSRIVQSKVLAVPIEQGLIYLQSLYVEDPQIKIPELKQVIVGHGDRVAMAPTVEGALDELFGASILIETAPEIGQDTPIARAASLYREARQQLQAGNWAAFGQAFDALGQALTESR